MKRYNLTPKIKNIIYSNWFLVLAAMLIGLCYFFFKDFPIRYDDDTMTNFAAAEVILGGHIDRLRTPIYPLFSYFFLWLDIRTAFHNIAVIQLIVFLASSAATYYSVLTLTKRKWLAFLASVFYLCNNLLPSFVNVICTESLSVSSTAALIALLVASIHSERKTLAASAAVLLLAFMIMLRPFFICFTPGVGIVILYVLYKNWRNKKTVVATFISSIIAASPILGYVIGYKNAYGSYAFSYVYEVNQMFALQQAKLVNDLSFYNSFYTYITPADRHGNVTYYDWSWDWKPTDDFRQTCNNLAKDNFKKYVQNKIEHFSERSQNSFKLDDAFSYLEYGFLHIKIYYLYIIVLALLAIDSIRFFRQRSPLILTFALCAIAVASVFTVFWGADNHEVRLITPAIPCWFVLVPVLISRFTNKDVADESAANNISNPILSRLLFTDCGNVCAIAAIAACLAAFWAWVVGGPLIADNSAAFIYAGQQLATGSIHYLCTPIYPAVCLFCQTCFGRFAPQALAAINFLAFFASVALIYRTVALFTARRSVKCFVAILYAWNFAVIDFCFAITNESLSISMTVLVLHFVSQILTGNASKRTVWAAIMAFTALVLLRPSSLCLALPVIFAFAVSYRKGDIGYLKHSILAFAAGAVIICGYCAWFNSHYGTFSLSQEAKYNEYLCFRSLGKITLPHEERTEKIAFAGQDLAYAEWQNRNACIAQCDSINRYDIKCKPREKYRLFLDLNNVAAPAGVSGKTLYGTNAFQAIDYGSLLALLFILCIYECYLLWRRKPNLVAPILFNIFVFAVCYATALWDNNFDDMNRCAILMFPSLCILAGLFALQINIHIKSTD